MAEIQEILSSLPKGSRAHSVSLARLAAYAALGRIGTPKAVAVLEGLLVKPDPPNEFESIMSAFLRRYSRARAQEVCCQRLAVLLDQRNAPVRRMVYHLEQLGHNYNPRAIALIQKALYSSKHEDVRTMALRSLARWLSSSGDTRDDVRRIVLHSLADPVPGVRQVAILGIGRCGDVRTIKNLSPLLDDPAPGVRDAAVGAICRLLNWKVPQLRGADNKMLPLDGFKERLEPVLNGLKDLDIRIKAGAR